MNKIEKYVELDFPQPSKDERKGRETSVGDFITFIKRSNAQEVESKTL